MSVVNLSTPTLLLDTDLLEANIRRMRKKLASFGLPLRLHCKTCKSVPVALLCQGTKDAPIAVATLAEAEYFARAGFTDIIYAVGLAPSKLPQLLALRKETGAHVKIITDNACAASAIARFGASQNCAFDVLIEIDCDGHRGGVTPHSPSLLETAAILEQAGQNVAGVLTHAGSAYELEQPSPAALRNLAAQEAAAASQAANRLRAAGHICPIVSSGSSPTALYGEDFQTITEIRAGVFPFQDCAQAALGICQPQEIALSVLCSVIGHRERDGSIIVDAGWTALSQDRGADFARFGYGLVADMSGAVLSGLRVTELNQEHGIISSATGTVPTLPVGSILRILPAHACAAANAFSQYHVLKNGSIIDVWPRCQGW